MVSAADRVKNPVRTSVWLNTRPPARSRRADQPAGLDRERITAASVRLLDAEGLAKFSMRRLAAELNVTAMSLYWYVDTKDDLLELALDAVYSEIDPPPAEASWQDRLRAVAAAYRGLLVRHPWVSPLAGKFLNLGPHSLLVTHTIQDVIRATGLPVEGRSGALSAVFQFVYGFGTVEGQFAQRSADAGLTQDQYFRQAMSAIQEQPDLDEFVEDSRDLMAARGGVTIEEMRDRDFTFALDLLIAGIDAMRARAQQSRAQ
ncbi:MULTISPECIES: TetR/AcrR family transcriptional regulator [unclassified Streptomyces]|uniref:TetR/AcrR family transcriptional regulator n=1 Tax=unclassified Streptomyces TaxID=2593676 RepID=UPI002ECFF93A|nr:TetR/AcrR family transcriptional regulator [Streptomyces sp. NBC_00891]WSY06663.1 TetR/AcrR family transcriptional regulator [Streptomyces sp. NBC_00890]WSZ08287.1 TetR/AcrR family transcriptional regulator [Streptomyces sp. NBC_00869]WSZ24214.1 TetR/AcrR family transcriptional regulator [Streptomyces sp. NBC_00870]